MLILIATTVLSAFPVPTNSEKDTTIPLLPAQQAVKKIRLPDGFSARVFAAEPEVRNPIDMAWDAQGRIWIAENYTYADRQQRFDLTLRDRIVVFQDADADGVVDGRTVFTDDVQMLTSVEVGYGGVWLMCPPNLMFIPDRNGDAKPDGPANVVLDGFTVADANYHNFANGLRFGPDGWLYGRCGGSCPGRIGPPGIPDDQRMDLEGGMWRYHPTKRLVEVLTTGTTNPWGHDWNRYYEAFFVNTVNGHLWHMIPGSHLVRPFTLDPNPYAYELIDLHADHWHFDTGTAWQDSRDGAANAFGGGHAHSGAMVYLGATWPEQYHDRLFTLNFHGRRANQERLDRNGSGYLAKHEPDFFTSDDPWFRGMDLSYGPDGNVFVLDWSDTGECHEHTGVHRTSGRIYKIVYDAGTPERLVDVKDQRVRDVDDQRLVTLHLAKNEWYTRQSRLELIRRATAGTLSDRARELLRTSSTDRRLTPDLRLRFMLTRYSVGDAPVDFLGSQLDDENAHVRAWAVRLLTDTWLIDDARRPAVGRIPAADRDESSLDDQQKTIDRLTRLARTESRPLVRLTLASTLQRLPLRHRVGMAAELSSHAVDADDHNLPLMVWYGLMPVAESHAVELAGLVARCRWPKTRRLISRRLAEQLTTRPEGVDRLLDVAADSIDSDSVAKRTVAPEPVDQEPELSVAGDILAGLRKGFVGWRRAAEPTRWGNLRDRLSTVKDPQIREDIQQLNVLFGDGRAMDTVIQVVNDDTADYAARKAALRTIIQAQPKQLRSICTRLLRNQKLNVLAAKGLARFDDRAIGNAIVNNYRRFRAPARPTIISILVSRRTFAAAMLDAMEEGKTLTADQLTAFDVRQLHSLGDTTLSMRIRKLWGEVRESEQAKKEAIEQLRATLQQPAEIANRDLAEGRSLFNKTCAKCHRMYGEGELIGPDLTGANRNNLDYLLENILDPSAVVSKDYRMTILELEDGRTLNGLVVTENPTTLTLQTQNELTVVLKKDVEHRTLTPLSPMPDGLLDSLSPIQIRRLMAYLQHPIQVPLP